MKKTNTLMTSLVIIVLAIIFGGLVALFFNWAVGLFVEWPITWANWGKTWLALICINLVLRAAKSN